MRLLHGGFDQMVKADGLIVCALPSISLIEGDDASTLVTLTSLLDLPGLVPGIFLTNHHVSNLSLRRAKKTASAGEAARLIARP